MYVSKVKGFEKCKYYSVKKDGSVYSYITNKFLKGEITNRGYKRYSLYTTEKKYLKVSAHRLVLMAFTKEEYWKEEVNHINEIKTDNRIENLEWVTSKENKKHSEKTYRNSILKNSIFTKEDILFIRENYKARCKKNGAKPLSLKYNCHRDTIEKIAKNKMFSWITK